MLLDHLEVDKADIVAHSMGGMVGVGSREPIPTGSTSGAAAPIGLEDYRLYVPPTPPRIIEREDKLTADGYRKQLERIMR